MAVSANEPLAPQNYTVPGAGGGTIAVSNLGTTGIQVIGADPTRKSITFINPNVVSTISVMVFQVADANGNSLLGTTFSAPGGGTAILVPASGGATGSVTFTGDCAQTAWAAVAQSSSNQGLTIITSRT